MIYQILDGQTVINTISADSAFMQAQYPDGNYREVEQVEPAPEPVVDKAQYLIDIGPFFDRFGAAKMAVLTSQDVGVKAILTDIQVRKWVDLQRTDVAQALAYVGSVVPSVTPQMRSTIITTAVSADENMVLRKLYF